MPLDNLLSELDVMRAMVPQRGQRAQIAGWVYHFSAQNFSIFVKIYTNFNANTQFSCFAYN